MKKIEYLFFAVVSLIVISFSFYPIIFRYQTKPAGRVYAGTEFFTQDYAGYVSTIKQGIQGNWKYTDKFTNEKLPQTFLYFPYLLMGHISSFVTNNAIYSYHFFRVVLGVIYIFLTYKLVELIFPDKTKSGFIRRVVCLIIVIFTSSLPIIKNGHLASSDLVNQSAEIEVFTRYLIQPHYLLANVLLLFTVYLSLLFQKIPKIKYIILSGISIFALTFFRPSNSTLFLISFFIFLAYNFFTNKERKNIFFFIINFLFSLPGFIYLYYLNKQYPYLPYFSYDLVKGINISMLDFVGSFGLNFIFAIVGFLIVIWKKKITQSLVLLYAFLLSVILCIFVFPKILPFNGLRFVQTPTFIFVGILASYTIYLIVKKIYYIVIITVLLLLLSLPTLIIDFRHQVHLYYDAYYIWPPRLYLEAFNYLEKNSSRNDLILTYHSLSNLVPMYSGNTVYWGHTNETLDYEKKKISVDNFYGFKMSEAEALKFLKDNKIRYVLVGREEKFLGFQKYDFLQKVFENDEIIVYPAPDFRK